MIPYSPSDVVSCRDGIRQHRLPLCAALSRSLSPFAHSGDFEILVGILRPPRPDDHSRDLEIFGSQLDADRFAIEVAALRLKFEGVHSATLEALQRHLVPEHHDDHLSIQGFVLALHSDDVAGREATPVHAVAAHLHI